MQDPAHPLIRSHLRAHERSWSREHRQNALSVLNRWHRWLSGRDLLTVTADDCRDYLNWRQETVTSTTAHKDYQHLRWFYRFLVEEEELDTRRPHGPWETVRPPAVEDPDPDRTGHVSPEDYARVMATFGRRSLIDCRDAAICSLMYWSGLRRSEVVRLDVDRMDLEAGTGQVLGKNKTWRTFPLLMETQELLARYLRKRDQAGDTATALFASIGGRGTQHTTTGRLRADAVSAMLDRRCDRAGIPRVSTHQFRRAMAINGKRRDVSESSLMSMAGWTDGRMLRRYIKRESEALAVAEVHASDPTRTGRARRRLRAVS